MFNFLFILFVLPFVLLEVFSSFCLVAFFSLSKAQLDALNMSKDSNSRSLARLMKVPEDVLITLLIQDATASILCQNIVSASLGEDSMILVNVGIPFLMSSIFAEVLPKSIAIRQNFYFAQKLSRFFLIVHGILLYPRKLMKLAVSGIVDRVSLLLKFYKMPSIKSQISAINVSDEDKIISLEEKTVLEGVVRFRSLCVKDIMLHRHEVEFIDLNDDEDHILSVLKHSVSKIMPVAVNSISDVLGVLELKDLVAFENVSIENIKSVLKRPIYVPESLPCQMLFEKIGTNCGQIVFVINEYGSICGAVTCFNIIESIYNRSNELSFNDNLNLYSVCGGGVVVDGMCRLDVIETLLSVNFVDTMGQITIGGLITTTCKVFPPFGSVVYLNNGTVCVQILSVHARRIKMVYLYNSMERS